MTQQEEEDLRQADLESREQLSIISSVAEGLAKRRRVPRRRHSLSPPRRSAEGRAWRSKPRSRQATGEGTRGGAASLRPSSRRPEEEFPRQPAMPEDAGINSRAVAGASRPLLTAAPTAQEVQQRGHSIPVVCAHHQQQAENVPVNLGDG